MTSLPDLLAAELRLPIGFTPVDRDAPPELEDALRVEIVDLDGRLRPWDWPFVVPWHEALGFRIADDGLAAPCDICGAMTHEEDDDGTPICVTCCSVAWIRGHADEEDGDAEEAPAEPQG